MCSVPSRVLARTATTAFRYVNLLIIPHTSSASRDLQVYAVERVMTSDTDDLEVSMVFSSVLSESAYSVF